ncbi:MAG: Multidrug resistance protein NorM [Chlamydiia bacterium]|nr:Multidrug resistance protein NorM [Chlamydiia bacterium]
MLMLFVDRLFLSHYSADAFNASAKAGTLAWSIIAGWMTLCGMAEVFVAQFNGAGQIKKLARPVWQMVYLALFSFAFFIPASTIGTKLIYGSSHPNESLYFFWMMITGPLSAVFPALGAFYIGQGRTSVITYLAIFGNTINIILDPLFIFGYGGIFPELGVAGAAVATGIGSLVQVGIIVYLILQKKHREKYNTHDLSFDWQLFKNCLKVGVSPAFFVVLEVLGWAVFYHMMALVSPMHIFISSILQSIVILAIFFPMGLEKGMIAVTGNMIGAKNIDRVKTALRSAFIIVGGYVALMGIAFVFFGDWIAHAFLANSSQVEASVAEQMGNIDPNLIFSTVKTGLIFIFVYITFESLRWVINGILTAAGDTNFLLYSGFLSIWLLMLTPTYFFVVKPKASMMNALYIWLFYSFSSFLILYFRYRYGKWKKIDIMHKKEEKVSTVPEQA